MDSYSLRTRLITDNEHITLQCESKLWILKKPRPKGDQLMDIFCGHFFFPFLVNHTVSIGVYYLIMVSLKSV